MNKTVVLFFILLIKAYQFFLSPFLGKNCRFNPTCSVYASQAIVKYGAVKGSYISIKRLIRCHPFSKSDYYDPI
ncbi:MAG: membrane protein insertion efficiency factor YidD [Candidatus Marinimicrobia bacterium]|nr:membrane protein insertion efficiency factor YidD [Candidatus Neomarinimicrobiota bacterium]